MLEILHYGSLVKSLTPNPWEIGSSFLTRSLPAEVSMRTHTDDPDRSTRQFFTTFADAEFISGCAHRLRHLQWISLR